MPASVGGARFIWVGEVAGLVLPKLVVWRRWCWTFADGDPQPYKPFSGDENWKAIPREAAIEEVPFNWSWRRK